MYTRSKSLREAVFISNEPGSSYTVDSIGVDQIDVTNGLVQGNRKSPNPITFTIREDVSGPIYQFVSTVTGFNPTDGGWKLAKSTMTGKIYSIPAAEVLVADYENDYSSLLDSAMGKLYSKVRDNANLAVDLAELGSTRRMFVNATRVWQQVLRVKRAIARLNAREAASIWLEARYGWMPLVYSTYDILDNMVQARLRNHIRVSGRESKSSQGSKRRGTGSFSQPACFLKWEQTERVQVSGSFEIPNSDQLYDYTSLNPALIAWELVPLSFVADWFVNVGDFLRSWENYMLMRQQWRGGYMTHTYIRREKRKVDGKTVEPYSVGASPDQIIVAQYERVHKFKNRQVLPNLPQPGGLRLNINIGAKRVVDAASLIRSAFR